MKEGYRSIGDTFFVAGNDREDYHSVQPNSAVLSPSELNFSLPFA